MRTFKVDLNQRLKTAAEAKEAALKKFAERKAEDDPAVLARKAARLDAAKAREASAAEREAKKLEEKARLIEEQAKKKAEAELEAAKEAERQEALAASRKRPAMRVTRRGKPRNNAGPRLYREDRRLAARRTFCALLGLG